MEIFTLKKLNDVKVKEKYHVIIWNRFGVLKNLDDDDDDIIMLGKVLERI
jgi:hypothetical protein